LNDPKAADDQFEAALLLEPKSVEAQIGAAKTQIAQGNFADAVQQLEGVSKSHPDNADVFEALAEAYAGEGKREEAQQAESRAKQLQKNKHR
jgi:predicted Zn-dependent protease